MQALKKEEEKRLEIYLKISKQTNNQKKTSGNHCHLNSLLGTILRWVLCKLHSTLSVFRYKVLVLVYKYYNLLKDINS